MTTANSYCWYCGNCDKVFSSMAREDGDFIEIEERFFHETDDRRLCGPVKFYRPGDNLTPSKDWQGIEIMNETNEILRALEE